MCGEPPPHTSDYTQARRLFADGHVDRNGLLRRLPSPGDLENDHHESSESSGGSGSSDGHDSGRAVGALKREVAKLFESESDEEQNQRGVKRAKVKADVFRPMPIRIPTTPVKAKPSHEPGLIILSIGNVFQQTLTFSPLADLSAPKLKIARSSSWVEVS